ncbi:MAG: HEAT repeat domain-containing protein [Actinomycetota bacterium]
MATDRDQARAEVARRGHSNRAVGSIGRHAFAQMPPQMVERARTQLARLFTDAPWTAPDDAALAALVGPGAGWVVEELEPGLTISHGWRGGAFRVDVDCRSGDEAPVVEQPAAAGAPAHPRNLGDTFDEPLVLESGRAREQARFLTGPRPGPAVHATRDQQGVDLAVRVLFETFSPITAIDLEPGVVTVTIADRAQWPACLLGVFDTVAAAFLPPRPPNPDRQLERAEAAIARLDPTDSRDLAKILDATTSPDAAFRLVAVARLTLAETVVAQRPWDRALEDSSRPVRRAAARAMALADAPPPRALCERALGDKDPCVRYYGLWGLARLGAIPSMDAVERCRADEDLRVRLAADAAALGIPVP